MEKSIEKIWKEGFLKADALVVPKLNNLYDQKSVNFINKYKRMFRLNIIWIVVGACALIATTLLIGMPFLGVPMFLLLITMAIVDKKLLNGLNEIDQNETSYDYLKSFLNWWDRKNKVNILMAKILYPYAFFSVIIGLWLMEVKENTLGTLLVKEVLKEFPNTPLIFGVPQIGILGVLIIAFSLLFFSKKLYTWDVNLVYGRVMEKINTLVKDMEELRD